MSRRVRIGIGLVGAGIVVAVVATWLPWLEYESTSGSLTGWDLVSYGLLRPGHVADTGPHWVFRSSWCEYATSTVVTALPVVAIAAVLAGVLGLVVFARRRGRRRTALGGSVATVVAGGALVLLWLRNFASFVDNCLHLTAGSWFELGAALLVVVGGALLLLDTSGERAPR